MLKLFARASLAVPLLTSYASAASAPAGGPAPATSLAQQALNNAIGACTEAAYTGSGTPTVCSLLKALYGQAVQVGTAGTPATQVLSVQPPASGGITFKTDPQSATPNLTGSGTITSGTGTASYVSIPTGRLASVGIQIGGTFVATLVASCSQDGDTTSPIAISFSQKGVNASTTPSAQTVTAPGNFVLQPGTCTNIRVTASSYTSGTVTVTWDQTGAPDMMRVGAPNAAPVTITNPYVAPQRSSALETCHVFTKPQTASVLKSIAVSGQSASTLWMFLMDLGSAPSSATNQAASMLAPPQKMGSDGASFGLNGTFGDAPLPSTNGFVACLSTTAGPTYTAAGAIGQFTGQVQ